MPHIHEKIIGLMYWARPRHGSLTLSVSEHHAICWCAGEDLDALQPVISEAVKWYCRKAIEEIEECRKRHQRPAAKGEA